jgi:hypothetical protein
VQNIPAERLHGNVDYRKGEIEYRLTGETLGGSFEIDGRIPPDKLRRAPASPEPEKPPAPQPEGRLRLRGVRLASLVEALQMQAALGPLSGVLDLQADYHHATGSLTPAGRGTFVVSGLGWGLPEPAGEVRGAVVLAEGDLRLSDLAGTVAGGLLRGSVALNLAVRQRGWFNLTLEGAEASRLLAPWTDEIEGSFSARLRGSLGVEWRGEAIIDMPRGRVYGVEVTSVRLPVGFALVPGQGRAQLDLRDASARAALGRVTGRASLGLGVGSRVDGVILFQGVDLATLLRQATDTGQVAAGRLSGRIDLGGTDIRSFRQVTAQVNASFSQTQALQLPVFRQLTPYIAPGRSTATFDSGDLRGRLAGGVFRVERLTLVGRWAQLFAEGTVTVEGRLNLDVMARTGQVGPDPRGLRLLGLLPAAGPVPIGLLVEARNYLSNRLIYLHVAGTIRSPVIRVRPLPLLAEEVTRFFLRQIGLPTTALGVIEEFR